MSNKGARNLFIFGSLLCFAVLVVLTIDTMGRLNDRAPVITEEVNAGKKVWHKYDCIGCGSCAEVCPAVFGLRDDAKAYVMSAATCDACDCQEAADICPTEAISFEG